MQKQRKNIGELPQNNDNNVISLLLLREDNRAGSYGPRAGAPEARNATRNARAVVGRAPSPSDLMASAPATVASSTVSHPDTCELRCKAVKGPLVLLQELCRADGFGLCLLRSALSICSASSTTPPWRSLASTLPSPDRALGSATSSACATW